MKKIYTILTIHFFLIFILGVASISLPSDMIENLMWGRGFGFISDKHPPFFGWQSYFTFILFGGSFTMYHILTPLNQILFLFFLYLLAKDIFKNEEKALTCIVLLQSVVFHSFYYKFNANTANLAFFGAIYYTYYKMIKEEKYHLYPVIGALCAIIMLIKYSGILLIGTLGVITLITKEGRKSLKSPYLFLGIIIFISIITPYVLHLINQGNDGAIHYLIKQSINNMHILFRFPMFIMLQTSTFIPMLIAFFIIKKNKINRKKNFEYLFLTLGFFIPIVLTLGYIIIKDAKVGFYWLSMYYGLSALLLLYFYNVKAMFLQTTKKIIYPIFGLMYCIYFFANLLNPEDNTKEFAKFLQEVREENNIQSDYYICNDSRRMCGIFILYGTDYTKSYIYISEWQTGFEKFKQEELKPNDLIIIGSQIPINIDGYELKTYKKTISKIHKFQIGEAIMSHFNSYIKMRTTDNITLTVAKKIN